MREAAAGLLLVAFSYILVVLLPKPRLVYTSSIVVPLQLNIKIIAQSIFTYTGYTFRAYYIYIRVSRLMDIIGYLGSQWGGTLSFYTRWVFTSQFHVHVCMMNVQIRLETIKHVSQYVFIIKNSFIANIIFNHRKFVINCNPISLPHDRPAKNG